LRRDRHAGCESRCRRSTPVMLGLRFLSGRSRRWAASFPRTRAAPGLTGTGTRHLLSDHALLPCHARDRARGQKDAHLGTLGLA
jgi:hypothetical protein